MSKAFNTLRKNKFSTKAGRMGAGVPVSGLSATANGATAMDLAWVDDEAAGDLVNIERSEDNATWAVIDTVAAADEAYADSGLTTATEYFYRVYVMEPGVPSASVSDTTA